MYEVYIAYACVLNMCWMSVVQYVTDHSVNPLTLSCHSMGSPDPELPETTLFVKVFFQNFQAGISALQE